MKWVVEEWLILITLTYIKPWKNKQILFNSLPKDLQKVMTMCTPIPRNTSIIKLLCTKMFSSLDVFHYIYHLKLPIYVITVYLPDINIYFFLYRNICMILLLRQLVAYRWSNILQFSFKYGWCPTTQCWVQVSVNLFYSQLNMLSLLNTNLSCTSYSRSPIIFTALKKQQFPKSNCQLNPVILFYTWMKLLRHKVNKIRWFEFSSWYMSHDK